MITNLLGCLNKKDSYYVYGKKDYIEKERAFNFNTKEAAKLFAKNYFSKNPDKKNVLIRLDIIYDNYYVFSDKIILYNAKTGYYPTEKTYWVDGNTGELIKPKKKKLKINLEIPKKLYFKKEFKNIFE